MEDPSEKHRLQDRSKSIEDLEKRIRTLEGFLRIGPGFIEKSLKSRGLQLAGFIPENRILQPIPPSAINLERFYHQLGHYSFRLFLRDVVSHRKNFNLPHLTRYCSDRVAKKYLHLLVDLGIALPKNGQAYRLVNPDVHTFGETLEWYVAQVFIREFASPALWGLMLQNLAPGGDFDVLAEVDRRLVYVEVKSSPPKGIHLPNVKGFLSRVATLAPNLSIFLVDTHLRMEDKINVLFIQAEETASEGTDSVQRIARGIFHVGKNVFTTNTKPDLITNIRTCLQYYFRNLDHSI